MLRAIYAALKSHGQGFLIISFVVCFGYYLGPAQEPAT
jgi:hypothetical protein